MLNFLIILHSIMKYNSPTSTPSTLGINQKVSEAKNLFNQQDTKVALVLDAQTFKGLLFEEDLENLDDDLTLNDIESILKLVYLTSNFSIFDWFKIRSLYDIDNIPLIDDKDFSYLNSIGYEDFIEKFRETGLNVELSSILILKKPTSEFKYSEVFQIAEANGAKIFGSYINFSDQDETEIILNLHHTGLNELLQSYRRYGFDVVSFHDEDLHHETIKTNSEYFSKYLTV